MLVPDIDKFISRNVCRVSSVGRSGDRMPVGARFSTPARTGPEAHAASSVIVTSLFPGGKATGTWHYPPTPPQAPSLKK